MSANTRIYMAAHRGMVGRATMCRLQVNCQENIITCTQPMQSRINVGFGSDVSIAPLARSAAKVVGCQGSIIFDDNKPDGPPRKHVDFGRLASLRWCFNVPLEEGLAYAYADFAVVLTTSKKK